MSDNEEKTNPVGRPPAIKNKEITESRIKIWTDHFYAKLPIWELTEKYSISKSTAKKAITWVNKNFLSIPSEIILRGAIFSFEERIKKMTAELDKELAKEQPSTRNMVEMNREIREDTRDLLKLQSLYKENYGVEIGVSGSVREILKELTREKPK